jgi:hypothetical protein
VLLLFFKAIASEANGANLQSLHARLFNQQQFHSISQERTLKPVTSHCLFVMTSHHIARILIINSSQCRSSKSTHTKSLSISTEIVSQVASQPFIRRRFTLQSKLKLSFISMTALLSATAVSCDFETRLREKNRERKKNFFFFKMRGDEVGKNI